MKNIFTYLFTLLTVAAFATGPIGDGVGIGEKAPDFSLKNIDGSFVSLADYKEAKGFIVIFTCNTCPYAVMYEDRIIELDKKYSAQGYQVIAINPNDPEVKEGDSPEAMVTRAKEKGFNFPYLFDAGQNVYPRYGATKTPHVYLLDSDHIVQYIGSIDDNAQDAAGVGTKYLEDAIAAVEAGSKPSPSETKAIGCGIKVKKAEKK